MVGSRLSFACRSMALRAGEIAGHRLFGEYRLAKFERPDRDLRLQARQRGDGDRLYVLILDQRAPVAVAFGNAFAARASSAVRAASLPASATTWQRGSARNAGNWTVRP